MKQQDKENNSQPESYVKVIGDTVYGKHLIAAICISVFLSLTGFFTGKAIFPYIAPDTMVQSYSLLLGIAGSLIGLLLNTFLFKPKRKLNETQGTNEELKEVYDELKLDIEEEREAILNDPVTMEEMKEQGIYDMFLSNEEGKHK